MAWNFNNFVPENHRMEIVVNTRLLIRDKLDGIGWFTYETLKRMTRSHPEHHFIFVFDRDPDENMIFSDNITPLVLGPQARHPILFWIWFEFSIGRLLKDLKPDLFLSPDGYLPLHGKTKKLAVIHDLNFAHYPSDVPWTVRKYYNYFFPRFASKASRIATVSRFSKSDITNTYHINPDKIDIVYNGADINYHPLPTEEQELIRNQYTKGASYFLFVGSLHPRKNIGRLLLAFALFKKETGSPMKLLLVGHRYWWTSELESIYTSLSYKEDVIFTGRLPQTELYRIMAAAYALTYIPYFEGFGIPLLEAMQCDVPVITSNNSSLPEVADNAALFVDPFSVESVADAMIRITKDKDLLKSLVEAGRIRRINFSWDRTAELLWQSVEKTVSGG
jgi:glycosyltransferase involved in cell wall biosynthesis